MGMKANEDLVQLLYSLFAVWPKASYLTSLNLCFFIWKMGVMLPFSWGEIESKVSKARHTHTGHAQRMIALIALSA